MEPKEIMSNKAATRNNYMFILQGSFYLFSPQVIAPY